MDYTCENKVILVGYIVLDPMKINNDPIGVKCRIATNETYFSKKHNKMVTQTEYHNLKLWKKHAIFALSLAIGTKIYIIGKLHYHEVVDSQNKIIKLPEIICSKLIKLEEKD